MAASTETNRNLRGTARRETAEQVDPFAAAVEPSVPRKAARAPKPIPAERVVPTVAEKIVEAERSAEPTPEPKSGKAAKATKAVEAADPFAQLAGAAPTSPVKGSAEKKEPKTKKPTVKRAAKSAAAKSKTPAKKAASKTKKKTDTKIVEVPAVPAEHAVAEPVEITPVFRVLATPTLPALERKDRARLQMQTPTRLYFYWSIKTNPWATLRNIFGDDLGSYTLVLKLVDQKNGYEELHPAEPEGSYWFDVEADGGYQAEIGFYAPNRPYFRVVYSNVVNTPRRAPSQRPASESQWAVSANKFAQVLDVAGFTRDAFDVAMAGDDAGAAVDASHMALSAIVGGEPSYARSIPAEDIRYALLAIAAGSGVEDLRHKVSERLYDVLGSSGDKLSAASARKALAQHFDVNESDLMEEEIGPTVFGASLLNFPRTLRRRSLLPKSAPRYNPVSSFSLR